MTSIHIHTSKYLPDAPEPHTAYRLIPIDPDPVYYRERTDRNLGWITPEEQEILRTAVVGIAGCGGMGGILAGHLTRAGIGEIRIADIEVFDASNINRQFGATRSTIGKSKAWVTAQLTRAITDDATLVVYPQGITEDTVDSFVEGCDVVLDEIEAFALAARILLHQRARHHGISLLNCNTVGFSANLFLYGPHTMTIEEATGIDREEAIRLEAALKQGDSVATDIIARAMLRAVVPILPEYRPDESETDHLAFSRRFIGERRVPIIATNPLFAAGFLADHLLLFLIRNSGVHRDVVPIPPMPGYLHVDAGHVNTQICHTDWRI